MRSTADEALTEDVFGDAEKVQRLSRNRDFYWQTAAEVASAIGSRRRADVGNLLGAAAQRLWRMIQCARAAIFDGRYALNSGLLEYTEVL